VNPYGYKISLLTAAIASHKTKRLMKTLALSTYVVFENEITAINEDEIKNIVSSIAEGLEDDLFIVLYTVFASPYIGFSDNIPKSGDLT
jgi:hypothetical protein